MLCFSFCMLSMKVFFPQEHAGMSLACFCLKLSWPKVHRPLQFASIDCGMKRKGTLKSYVNISPQICTNIWWSSSAAGICLRFWVASVQLQPPCCVACTHMFDPRSKSIMLILNHLGPRRTPRDSCTRLPLGDQPPCSAHSIATILQNCTQIH